MGLRCGQPCSLGTTRRGAGCSVLSKFMGVRLPWPSVLRQRPQVQQEPLFAVSQTRHRSDLTRKTSVPRAGVGWGQVLPSIHTEPMSLVPPHPGRGGLGFPKWQVGHGDTPWLSQWAPSLHTHPGLKNARTPLRRCLPEVLGPKPSPRPAWSWWQWRPSLWAQTLARRSCSRVEDGKRRSPPCLTPARTPDGGLPSAKAMVWAVFGNGEAIL